ncbi:MAG: hypothetical protein CMP10_18895 [Zetaproteobacteria bacterium]|nr:hypothetical protein [Pseudobdellovibrionaceae bacterium]
MNFKKYLQTIHLWLGLGSGLIVFVICVAASLFVFEKELESFFYADYFQRPVSPSSAPTIPADILLAKVQDTFPNQKISSMKLHAGPRTYEFISARSSDDEGLTFFSTMDYWNRIFVNPEDGSITGVIDQMTNPIYLFRVLHQQLLLRGDIGQEVVAVATLVFLAMVLTGLILWWPRKLKNLKHNLLPTAGKSLSLLSYNLHRIGGFYVHIFIVLLGTTGLVWSYKWWLNLIFFVMGQDPQAVYWKQKVTPPTEPCPAVELPLQQVTEDAISRHQNWTKMTIYLPEDRQDKNSYFLAAIKYDGGSGWDESLRFFYHPQCASPFHQVLHNDKSLGEKWRNSNYAIHVGSIYGMPTKVLAFIVAAFAATMPITGFLIWKKKRRRKIARFFKRFTKNK